MTIDIYRSAVCAEPAERIEFAGTIAQFMKLHPFDYESLPERFAAFHDGAEVPFSDWDCTPACGSQIRPVAHGFDPITWAYIAAAALMAASLLMQPGAQASKTTPQGKNLSTAEATANSAKTNAVVPEMAGKFLRYPDYLTAPRRYFADPRTQYMETLLCMGPGTYDIERVQIGNTEFASLEGTEYVVYAPGADVSVDGLNENWYNSKEVGGTSAGTAGLELSVDPIANSLPTGTSYAFDGSNITSDVDWPRAWGEGTQILAKLQLPYSANTIGDEVDGYKSEITGTFSHLQPLSVASTMHVTMSGQDVALIVNTITPAADGKYTVTFIKVGNGEGESNTNWVIPDGNWQLAFSSDAVRCTVVSITDKVAKFSSVSGWFGFPQVTLPSASVSFQITNDVLYGEWAGPFFAMPRGETATVMEYDLFFPQGLCEVKSSGDLAARSVLVSVNYRQEGATEWTALTKTYTDSSLDQIGFTERLVLPRGRYEFRHRRTSAASTSTQINDKVQLYGLRSLLETPTSYEGWTTIGVRIKGLGKIASSSENQINVLATRMLATLSSPVPVPTRDISAFFKYIASTVGYSDLQIDNDALAALHAIWTQRGDTLDHIFDATTARAAMATALRAGMGELTISDAVLTPLREGLRPQHGKVYSKQNTTSEIRRSFKTPRHDDNDGVQVEYVSAEDNYTVKTIDCKLPGSAGIRLEKLKLDGVTDKTRAWRIGMRRVREMRYQRWSYEFSTELDAFVSDYLDRIELVPDIPNYGKSSVAVGARRVDGGIEIACSELIVDHFNVAAWRDTKGNFVGPFGAYAVGPRTIVASAPGNIALPSTSSSIEPSHIYLGTITNVSLPALIERIAPNEKTASVQAVNYDPRKYEDDDNFPAN